MLKALQARGKLNLNEHPDCQTNIRKSAGSIRITRVRFFLSYRNLEPNLSGL